MTGATLESGEPIGSAAGGITRSAWWKIDLSFGSHPRPIVVSFHTYYPAWTLSGGQYDEIDTALTVWQGTTLAGLMEVTSNAGYYPGGSGAGSSEWWPNNQHQGHVTFTAVAGQVYYLQLGTWQDGRLRLEQLAVIERPALDGKVLFFAPSLMTYAGQINQAAHSAQHRFVRDYLGYQTEIVDHVAWNAKTTADFAAYHAIIIGERGDDGFSTLFNTAAVWGPAIAGNMVLAQSIPEWGYELRYSKTRGYRPWTGDAIYDYPGWKMIQNLMSYAVSSEKGCGLCITGRIDQGWLAGLPGGGGGRGSAAAGKTGSWVDSFPTWDNLGQYINNGSGTGSNPVIGGSGGLQMPAGSGPGTSELAYVGTLDLTGSYWSIHVTSLPTTGTFRIAMDSSSFGYSLLFEWDWTIGTSGGLNFFGNSYHVLNIPWPATQAGWWAIKDDNGTLRFYTSLDGTTWTEQYNEPMDSRASTLSIDLIANAGGTASIAAINDRSPSLFNGFSTNNSGFDNGHITVPEHPLFTTPNILTDGTITGWIPAIQGNFTRLPSGLGYVAVACDLDNPGSGSGYTNEDGTAGFPYIIVRDAPSLPADLPTDAQPIRFCDSLMLSDVVTKRWLLFTGCTHVPRIVPVATGKAMFVTKHNALDQSENTGVYVNVPESFRKEIEFTYRFSNQSAIAGTNPFRYMMLMQVGRDPTPPFDTGLSFGYLYQFVDGHISFDNRAELDENSSGSLRLQPDTDYRIQIKAKWYIYAGQIPPYPGSVEVRVNGATWINVPNAQLSMGNTSSQGLTKVAFGSLEHQGGVYADIWISNIIIRDDIGDSTNWDFLPVDTKVIGLRTMPGITNSFSPNDVMGYADWRYAEYQVSATGSTANIDEETPDDDLSYLQLHAGDTFSSYNYVACQGLARGGAITAVAVWAWMRAEIGTSITADMRSMYDSTANVVRTVTVADKYRPHLAIAGVNPGTSAPWVLGSPLDAANAQRGHTINNLVPDVTFSGLGRLSYLGVEVVIGRTPAAPPSVGSPTAELALPMAPVLVDSFAHEQEDQLGGSEAPSSDYRVMCWEGADAQDAVSGNDPYIRTKSWKWLARYGDVSFHPADTSGNGAYATITGYRSSLDNFLVEISPGGLYGPAQIGFGFFTDPVSQWESKGVVDPTALIRLLTTYMLRDSTQWPGSLRITVSLRRDGHLVLNTDRGAQSIFHGLNAVSTIPLPDIATRQVIEVRWLTGYDEYSSGWGYAHPFIELRINGVFAGMWELPGNDQTNPDQGLYLDPVQIYGGYYNRYKDSSDYVRLGGDWLNPGDQHNLGLRFSDFYMLTMDFGSYAGFQNDYHGNQYFGTGLRVIPQIPASDVVSGTYSRTGSGTDSGAIGASRDTLTSDRHQSTIVGGTSGTHSVYALQPAAIPDDGRVYIGTFPTAVVYPLPSSSQSPPRAERKGATASNYDTKFWYKWSGRINAYQQVVPSGRNDNGFWVYGDGAYLTPDYFLTAATWNASTKGLQGTGSSTALSQLVFESLIGSPAVATVAAPPQVWFQIVG